MKLYHKENKQIKQNVKRLSWPRSPCIENFRSRKKTKHRGHRGAQSALQSFQLA